MWPSLSASPQAAPWAIMPRSGSSRPACFVTSVNTNGGFASSAPSSRGSGSRTRSSGSRRGNIIKYGDRPHLSPAERQRAAEDPRGRWRVSEETIRRHDEELLDAINRRVDKRDRLWVVGDFCMGGRGEAAHYRSRIHCEW